MAKNMSVGHYADGCLCASCLIIRRDALCTRCAGTRKDVRGNFCTDCNGWGTRMAQGMTLEIRAKYIRDNYAHLPGADDSDVSDDDYFDGVTGPNAYHRYG